jgi:AraC family transcriptional regulator
MRNGELYVSTFRIQMISKGRSVPFFGEPDLKSADHPWAGYSFEEACGPAEPIPSHSWSKTTLLYVTGGYGSLNWKHRGTWRTDSVQLGTVSIIRRDAEIQTCIPSNPIPTMLLQLDNSKLQHIAPDYVLTIDKSLGSAQVADDHRLAALMRAMRDEVKEGCPSGRLFGESISLALLAYLAGKYATPRCEKDAAALSPAQKRRILDHVQENLSGDISVTELSGLMQMSPSHFTRVFKDSFGVTPYKFVMQARIEKAKDMLAHTNLTASQVAMAFGFASQSHLVKVFRQFTGLTPKQYKAGF